MCHVNITLRHSRLPSYPEVKLRNPKGANTKPITGYLNSRRVRMLGAEEKMANGGT